MSPSSWAASQRSARFRCARVRPARRLSNSEGYQVTRVDVDRAIAQTLAKLCPDVAFNALHGRFGEDGIMQSILEMLRIPYTHSGVLASALAMRKDRAKELSRAAGIPVAEGITTDRFTAAKNHVLPPPYVIKPVDEGSSVGVLIVRAGQTRRRKN